MTYLPKARGAVHIRAKAISGAFKSHGIEFNKSLNKEFAKWPEYYDTYEAFKYLYPKEFRICDTVQNGSFYKNQRTEASAPFYWFRP